MTGGVSTIRLNTDYQQGLSKGVLMCGYPSFLIFHLLLLFCSVAAAKQSPQIIPADELRDMRALLPQIIDENYGDVQGDGRDLNDILHDTKGFVYDKRIGVLYQVGSEGRQRNRGFVGFADANKNLSAEFFPQDQPDSAKEDGQAGNPNILFPWNPLAGALHLSHEAQTGKNISGVRDFKIFDLPVQRANDPNPGEFWPVTWFTFRLTDTFSPNDKDTFYNWMYPVGTVLFEIITLKDSEDNRYVCEVRVRIRESDRWAVDRFMPCPTAKDLQQAILEWPKDWEGREEYLAFLRDNDTPQPSTLTSGDRGSRRFGTNGLSFHVTCNQDVLPPLPHDLVKAILLYRPFKSVLGKEWKPGCTGVTTLAEFNIVPYGYLGGFVGIDVKSCTRCHIDGLGSSRERDAEVPWYGRIRGNYTRNELIPRRSENSGGSILSLHMQEPLVSIGQVEAQPFKPNQMFVSTGMLAHYKQDPVRFPAHIYQPLYRRK